MDRMTIEVMKAQYNLAMTQVDERLQLPIQRYVEALDKELNVLREKKDTDWLDGIFAELRAELAAYKRVAEAARAVITANDIACFETGYGFYALEGALAELDKVKNE